MIQQKVTKNTLIWLGILVALLTVVTRFFMLTEKPIHFDEGINGWFSMQMAELGFYRYDPQNYHGPLYFYLLHWSEFIFGQSLAVLRLVPTVFGISSVVLFIFAAQTLAKRYLIIAVALLFSPAFIFFSRSGIHEVPFVFFQLVFGLGLNQWLKSQSQKSLMSMVVGLFGMALLKETFAIVGLAFVVSVILMGPGFWKAQLINVKWSQKLDRVFWKFTFSLLVLFFLFFSGFLRNPVGALDFFKAFMPWLKTGAHGNGHEKEFLYWIKTLLTTEPLVIFALATSAWGILQRKSVELRFWGFFAVIQLLIYSLIPYKTVWCVVSLIWPTYFILAEASATLFLKSKKWARIFLALAGLLILFSFKTTYYSSFSQPLDFNHPFIYVNSTYAVKELQEYLDHQLKENSNVKNQMIQVGMPEQWPWPYILRNYKSLSYELCSKEVIPSAAGYFCEIPESPFVERLFQEPYWKITAVLRQTRSASVIYLKKSTFPKSPSETAELVGPEEK